MKKAPIIGISSDQLVPSEKNNLTIPFYALKENYLNAITDAGGIPLIIPFCIDKIPEVLDIIDGVLVSGGDFDIDPALYGQDPLDITRNLSPRRTNFEISLTEETLKRDMPLLGICGGEQILNVVLGGTLYQDLPAQVGTRTIHEQKSPPREPSHAVKLSEDSLLYRIMQESPLQVNSTHHQAVRDVGKRVRISARAEDGVIEAIESPDYRFALGVQWHPEALVTNHKLFMTGLTSPPHDENRWLHPRKAGFHVECFHGKIWEKIFRAFVCQAGLK